ncbi:DUF3858 domain-containing protein [Xanthocytophaga agilis]|uniref:DUF3857 domain-containing protein n=1 Tax=Xanthocytophaga agilis TaxID=3048010 RepID=A0AAE3UAW1_9BACT|nr:DUF3857 domain-containing protein [Xanthocytophaga agilis]MDJ1499153.1 DUF3857 domain-containing protein [Xanthocytophaga agilis]
MKHRFFIQCLWYVALSVVSIHLTFAQADPIKFGKIELADLQMKSYDKDTSADAVVLCDYGKAFFNNNLQIQFERIVRIKILKKSGYSWADGIIPFLKSTGAEVKIMDLKGVTYNLQNGEIIKEKMSKEAVFSEKKSKNLYFQKFTLPNVKEGSVIEYTYTTVSDFWYEFHNWTFQKEIPVIWSEYRASIPEYLSYKLQMSGYEAPHISKTEPANVSFGTTNVSGKNYRWVFKDVPALKEEPYITTIDDYVSKIEFELANISVPGVSYKSFSNNWTSICENMLTDESFGGQIKKTGFVKEFIAKIKSENKEPLAQAIASYDFVRKSIKWNEVEDVYSDATKKAYETHSGTTADINLLLIAMLKEIGLDAKPVLLSTRENGKILPFYATISKFNYVIAHVQLGENSILLDATDEHISPGMLPTRCLNGIGRLIDSKGGDWIALDPKERASQLINVQMAINEDGELSGKIEKSLAGYDAWTHRKEIIAIGKDKHTENLKKEHPTWQISKIDLINLDKYAEAFSEKYELTMGDASQKAGNIIYLKPLLSEALTDNPFKHQERKFPVDFATAMDRTYVATITVPEGFKVEEMPKNAIMALPENAGRFSFMAAVNGNTIQISSKISIRKPIFYAEEYAALRELYAQIVSKHAEQIVLKKI